MAAGYGILIKILRRATVYRLTSHSVHCLQGASFSSDFWLTFYFPMQVMLQYREKAVSYLIIRYVIPPLPINSSFLGNVWASLFHNYFSVSYRR